MKAKDYLEKNIKEVIEEFPKVGKLLEKKDILCINCGLATCKLKDIIEIHNLSKDEEASLLREMFNIIFPGEKVRIPNIKKKVKNKNAGFSMPMQMLVDEHKLIKRLLALIPTLIKEITFPKDKKLVENIVDFIRNYADKFHHAKEEDLLFKYFDSNLDILKVMYDDHEKGRNYVKAIVEGGHSNDAVIVSKNLKNYHDLLSEHIKKEDEVLYPFLQNNLSISQIGDLNNKFNEINNSFNFKKYEDFILQLENTYL